MNNYVKTPMIYQGEQAECGAACLAMVLAYYGIHKTVEELKEDTNNDQGCSAKLILHTAKKYGLECKGFRREAKELKEIATPSIIYWLENDFVVLEGFQGNIAYLNDPELGSRKMRLEELEKCYSMVCLELSMPNTVTENEET